VEGVSLFFIYSVFVLFPSTMALRSAVTLKLNRSACPYVSTVTQVRWYAEKPGAKPTGKPGPTGGQQAKPQAPPPQAPPPKAGSAAPPPPPSSKGPKKASPAWDPKVLSETVKTKFGKYAEYYPNRRVLHFLARDYSHPQTRNERSMKKLQDSIKALLDQYVNLPWKSANEPVKSEVALAALAARLNYKPGSPDYEKLKKELDGQALTVSSVHQTLRKYAPVPAKLSKTPAKDFSAFVSEEVKALQRTPSFAIGWDIKSKAAKPKEETWIAHAQKLVTENQPDAVAKFKADVSALEEGYNKQLETLQKELQSNLAALESPTWEPLPDKQEDDEVSAQFEKFSSETDALIENNQLPEETTQEATSRTLAKLDQSFAKKRSDLLQPVARLLADAKSNNLINPEHVSTLEKLVEANKAAQGSQN